MNSALAKPIICFNHWAKALSSVSIEWPRAKARGYSCPTMKCVNYSPELKLGGINTSFRNQLISGWVQFQFGNIFKCN